MNNMNEKKETARHFKPAVGSTVTYGMLVFLFFHILGFFIDSLDWVWHLPAPIVLLGALALGTALHWLVFKFSSSPAKE